MFCSVICFCSCSSFLDKVPDNKLAIPADLYDLSLLLNNPLLFTNLPYVPQVLSDDYYVTVSSFNSVTDEKVRDLYLWQRQENEGWNKLYQGVYNANVLLEELPKISYDPSKEQSEYDRIYGSALFFRAFYHFWTAQLYCRPFRAASAETDQGIPIRTGTDIAVPTVRSTVKESYDAIIADLMAAVALLPVEVPTRTQPGKAAAYGLLGRVFLCMGDYENSYRYADSCIGLFGEDQLLDFRSTADITPTATLPFSALNREVIFHAIGYSNVIINQGAAKIDTVLYTSYDANDIRKTAYFRTNTGTNAGSYAFKGSYAGSATSIFFGIALDEMLLMRAETAVRLGSYDQAVSDLNTLLVKRWKQGTYIPYTAMDREGLLGDVMKERRKELLWRGLRWMDIRRLDVDSDLIGTPTRMMSDKVYRLEAGSERLTILIPQTVINYSNMQQNP